MDLYGLPLDEFIQARDAAAKKDKSLKALRKPTVAAWLVNQLVRHEKGTVEGLLELGDLLRAAQSKLDSDQLRELTEQRRTLLRSLAKEARALGKKLGQKVSEATEQEVIETLSAALADKDLGEQVRRGQLTEGLHFAGFGDLLAIVPKPRPAQSQLEEELKALRAAREVHDKATKRVEALKKELRQAEEEEERARARLSELENPRTPKTEGPGRG